MQAIHNAIGQLQDPYFYGNDVKTSSQYNAFSSEAFIRRMDAIRMRHHPMEDETAINRAAENLRGDAEDWWLAICATEPDTAPVRTQWEAFVQRFKFSFCKEATRWDTTIAYLELKQRPEQPPNQYLHQVIRLYTRESQALLAEQIKLFADGVTYTFSQTQSDTLLHGTAAEQTAQKRVIGEIIRESIVQALEHASNHRRDMDITKAMALNCKPDHVRQAIRLKAPKGLPPLELEQLIMLQVQSRDKGGAASGNSQKKSTTAAGVASTDATSDAHVEEEDAGVSATNARGGGPPHVVTAAGDAVAARGQTPAPTVRRVSRPSERGTTPALAGVSNADGAPGARGSNVSSSSINRRRSSTCRRPINALSTRLPPARMTTAVTNINSSIGLLIGLASPALAQLASRATARRPWTPQTSPRTGRPSRTRRRRSSTPTPSTGPRETGMRREARRDAATSLLRGGRLSRSRPPRSTSRSLPMVPQFSADPRPLRHRCQPQLHPGNYLSLSPRRGRRRQAPA
jgi:hypothetical protein